MSELRALGPPKELVREKPNISAEIKNRLRTEPPDRVEVFLNEAPEGSVLHWKTVHRPAGVVLIKHLRYLCIEQPEVLDTTAEVDVFPVHEDRFVKSSDIFPCVASDKQPRPFHPIHTLRPQRRRADGAPIRLPEEAGEEQQPEGRGEPAGIGHDRARTVAHSGTDTAKLPVLPQDSRDGRHVLQQLRVVVEQKEHIARCYERSQIIASSKAEIFGAAYQPDPSKLSLDKVIAAIRRAVIDDHHLIGTGHLQLNGRQARSNIAHAIPVDDQDR